MQLLTVKQEKFCQEYILANNSSDAYRLAYPASLKWKPASVHRKAKCMMDDVKIVSRIKELQAPVLKRLEVTMAKTLKRLMQGQEFDVRKLYKEDEAGTGNIILKQPHELDDDTAKAVIGVKYDSAGELLEYKIIDVKGCAELLGKHQKLFTDQVDVNVKNDNLHPEYADTDRRGIKEMMKKRSWN